MLRYSFAGDDLVGHASEFEGAAVVSLSFGGFLISGCFIDAANGCVVILGLADVVDPAQEP
ncbi:MAG TPA: hypothetical protein DDX19_23910 [Rhodopirellula baltica]|nr:hypothetical protein [Rhodopirellula baltica]